ncbi:hypothetical protein AB0N92_04040 [Streptomyces sp. NPDC093248]|uniref:hypothetical protein n=1 Tax=Streptomyces sp. NPDC093248 TaxID=3155072 RepID=UPI00341453B3
MSPVNLAEVKLVQVGFVLLPEYFAWGLELPEMNATDDNPRGLIVSFKAKPDGLEIMLIHGANLDLDYWLPYVVDRLPMEHWKSVATAEMVRWLAQDEVRRWMPQLAESDERPKVPPTREQPAAKRKRFKITEQHLKEVARIYRQAVYHGEPPTMAVADAFEVAHSTAAKWVGAARRDGHLEGVEYKH